MLQIIPTSKQRLSTPACAAETKSYTVVFSKDDKQIRELLVGAYVRDTVANDACYLELTCMYIRGLTLCSLVATCMVATAGA